MQTNRCRDDDHETWVDAKHGIKPELRCRKCALRVSAIYCVNDKSHYWFNPPYMPARTAINCHFCPREPA